MVITMAKLRMAHASTHGARKPLGPKRQKSTNKSLKRQKSTNKSLKKDKNQLTRVYKKTKINYNYIEERKKLRMAHTSHLGQLWDALQGRSVFTSDYIISKIFISIYLSISQILQNIEIWP